MKLSKIITPENIKEVGIEHIEGLISKQLDYIERALPSIRTRAHEIEKRSSELITGLNELIAEKQKKAK